MDPLWYLGGIATVLGIADPDEGDTMNEGIPVYRLTPEEVAVAEEQGLRELEYGYLSQVLRHLREARVQMREAVIADTMLTGNSAATRELVTLLGSIDVSITRYEQRLETYRELYGIGRE